MKFFAQPIASTDSTSIPAKVFSLRIDKYGSARVASTKHEDWKKLRGRGAYRFGTDGGTALVKFYTVPVDYVWIDWRHFQMDVLSTISNWKQFKKLMG